MKRYDITVKSRLRKAGIELVKYVGKSQSRVGVEGVDVQQNYGIVSIDARRLYTKAEIMDAIGEIDAEIIISSALEEGYDDIEIEESIQAWLQEMQPEEHIDNLEVDEPQVTELQVINTIAEIGNGRPVSYHSVAEVLTISELETLGIFSDLVLKNLIKQAPYDSECWYLTKEGMEVLIRQEMPEEPQDDKIVEPEENSKEELEADLTEEETMELYFRHTVKTLDIVDEKLRAINEVFPELRLRIAYSEGYGYIVVDGHTYKIVKSLREKSLQANYILQDAYALLELLNILNKTQSK